MHNYATSTDVDGEATLLDMTDTMRTACYRWLTVLTVRVPLVDIVHAALRRHMQRPGHDWWAVVECSVSADRAWPSTGVSRAAGAGSRGGHLLLLEVFQARSAQRITAASYSCTPASYRRRGSNYNHRWELHGGANPEQYRYDLAGRTADPSEFTPAWDHRPTDAPPSIVWLGRIDPLKDLETLIRAAAIVHQEMPRVKFVLYGKAPKGNEWYEDRCRNLRDELGLKETVIFAGFAASAEAAYNGGDLRPVRYSS